MAARKTTAKKLVTKVYIQYAGQEHVLSNLYDLAKTQWLEAGHEEKDLKSIDVYVKPEENNAYYVVNDTDKGCIGL
ncbi:MAG: DUF6465 family protein [Clostridiales bacterium]|nr:DUF6465 family protein [Clostridiales bacterium]